MENKENKKYILSDTDEIISIKEAKKKYADYFMSGEIVDADKDLCIIRILSKGSSEGLLEYKELFGYDTIKNEIFIDGNNVQDLSGGISIW